MMKINSYCNPLCDMFYTRFVTRVTRQVPLV